MKNSETSSEIRSFCKILSQSVIERLLQTFEDVSYDENDENILEELRTRVSFAENQIKSFYLDTRLPDCLESEEDDSDMTVSVVVFRLTNKFSVSADNCPIDGSPVGLHINIFLDTQMNDIKDLPLGDLTQEIENSIRHEIEHIIQVDFPDMVNYLDYHKIDFRSSKHPSPFCLYLTQPAEVSAHVRGYEQTSSTHFEFYRQIVDLLSGYVSRNFLTEDEYMRVFLCWKDWFQRNTYIQDLGEELCAK